MTVSRPPANLLAPYALLGGAQVAVGAAAIFARYALTGAGPLAVSASRLSIAAIVLLAIAALSRHEASSVASPAASRTGLRLAIAGLALAIHFGTWIASLQYANVAVSTLLVATTPIWTASYDALVRARPLSRRSAFAFVAGALGLVMVAGFNATAPPIPGRPWLGAALAIAGGMAMAAYLLLVRDVRSTTSTRAIVTRTYGWAAIALIATAAIAHQSPPRLTDAAAWGGILGMALISQLLGHTALNAALRWFTPSAVGFSTLIEPVAAAVLAFFIFGEALAPVALAGGVVLLAATGVVLRDERADIQPESVI